MPMKKGHSREVISENIKEMVKAGYKPKQAMAAALAEARNSKKMAEGGMIDSAKKWLSDEFSSESANEYHAKVGEGLGKGVNKDKAAALAKGMGYADGGMVEEEDYRSLADLMKEGDQGPVSNPEVLDMRQKLANSLHEQSEMEEMEYMAKGGLVEGMDGDEKPSNIVASTGEPMSSIPKKDSNLGHDLIEGVPRISPSPLSSEAMEAIKKYREKRKFKK